MKRFEKDIKKNSIELIESSLPEISSLDSVQPKAKKKRYLPLCFAPLGAAALVVTAILIPTILKGTSTSSSSAKHKYSYNFENYKPTFHDFNEVVYYSYFAYNQENTSSTNKGLCPHNKLMLKGQEITQEETEHPRGEAYEDEYGRTHYPIPYGEKFVFSEFLFFEFDSVDNEFLEQRIGNGHIYGLSVQTNIMDNGEKMLILKKGEYFYSCLSNGGGTGSNRNKRQLQYSAHKTIEGFDVIKSFANNTRLTLTFDCRKAPGVINYERLETFDIDGETFNIDPSTVFFDPLTISFDLDELKERLQLDPNFAIVDSYGGPDALVYDETASETNAFTLDEFEDTFIISEDKLYLGEVELIELKGANKIFASEINLDGRRELVFESLEEEQRVFNIYDVHRNKYLYHKPLSEIGAYDYYLGLRDNHLVVNLFEPGLTNDDQLLDYGHFIYSGSARATIVWQSLLDITSLELNGVFEADGVTPIEPEGNYYCFNSNTPYIIEIKLGRISDPINTKFPSLDHQVKCTPYDEYHMPNESPSWTYLSMENGIYRYQISFSESGYSYYNFSLYIFSFEFDAAIDVPPIVEPIIE